MKISYNEAKRSLILDKRGLDIGHAAVIFDGFHLTRYDAKHSEDEDRYITVGIMFDEIVLTIWTQRKDQCRIVTMWKANERERELFRRDRERSG